MAKLTTTGAGAVSGGNVHGESGPSVGAAVAVVRPVVLVRYRPGVVGESVRTVHVVPLPVEEHTGAIGTVCDATLMLDDVETVSPREGMPCMPCLLSHVTATTPVREPPAGSPAKSAAVELAARGACYQEWGWPVTLHRDQVRLSLHHEVSALALPVPLCSQVTEVLIQRRCAPAVLAHPYMPEHHIILIGERYGVALPWPDRVHRVTGVLLLPPTVTPRGPIAWTQSPCENSLRLCREIDLFGVLRTTVHNSDPGGDPSVRADTASSREP